ncbi:hypothetical protein [Streptomyces sp. NPDC093109]|uniref:hypothetical protein n=1 Tax=Streptomyces sp. NPDC093109 TaxID=3154977 RepID=UPI00344D54C1
MSGLNVRVPVRDKSAAVNGLRSHGWWVAAGARFRIASAPGVRITTATPPTPPDAARPAADLASVRGESELRTADEPPPRPTQWPNH